MHRGLILLLLMILSAYGGNVPPAQAQQQEIDGFNVPQTQQNTPFSFQRFEIVADPPPDLRPASIDDATVLSVGKFLWQDFEAALGRLETANRTLIQSYTRAPVKVLSIEVEQSDNRLTFLIIGSTEESAIMDSCERLALQSYATGVRFNLFADKSTNPIGATTIFIWLNALNPEGNASGMHCTLREHSS